MLTRNILVAVLTAGLMACGGCMSAMKSKEATGNPDKFFMTMASQVNASEIAAGRLATERASSPQVKQYGQRMIDDHTKAQNELKQLAQQKGVTLPNRPDEMHMMMAAHLSELSGAMFDREYISGMTGDHAKVVSIFQDKAKLASDPDVKAWAGRMVPILEEHLRMARELDHQLGGASTVGCGEIAREKRDGTKGTCTSSPSQTTIARVGGKLSSHPPLGHGDSSAQERRAVHLAQHVGERTAQADLLAHRAVAAPELNSRGAGGGG